MERQILLLGLLCHPLVDNRLPSIRRVLVFLYRTAKIAFSLCIFEKTNCAEAHLAKPLRLYLVLAFTHHSGKKELHVSVKVLIARAAATGPREVEGRVGEEMLCSCGY